MLCRNAHAWGWHSIWWAQWGMGGELTRAGLLPACFRGTLLCLFLLLFGCFCFFFFHRVLFKDCLFLLVFFISQQGQDMGFTTLQAPAMLL